MPPARTVSRADFARMAGVSRAAITLACKGPLGAACDGDRINIDHPAAASYLAGKAGASAAAAAPGAGGSGGAAIPARAPTKTAKSTPEKPARAARDATKARAKPKKATKKPTAVRPKKAANKSEPNEPSKPPPPPEPPIPAPKELGELEEVNRLLVPLVEKFGTSRRLRDWVLSLKDIESIRAKYLSNEEMQGRLISRELVQAHVMGVLAGLARKLLKDTPKTIARKLSGHFAAKGTVEEAERIVRDSLSSQIDPVKERTVRTLRKA